MRKKRVWYSSWQEACCEWELLAWLLAGLDVLAWSFAMVLWWVIGDCLVKMFELDTTQPRHTALKYQALPPQLAWNRQQPQADKQYDDTTSLLVGEV